MRGEPDVGAMAASIFTSTADNEFNPMSSYTGLNYATPKAGTMTMSANALLGGGTK
jgi:hypothetical protein